MRIIKNSLLILFFHFLLIGNQNVFDWDSMTSLINPSSIIEDSNNDIIAASSGGLLKLSNDNLSNLEDNLDNLNLSLIGLDSKGLIWTAGSFPDANIQVFDSEYNLIYNSIYSLPSLESIIEFQFSEEKVFAIYSEQNDIGILEFNYDNDIPYYIDYYNVNDFPESINLISDIDLYENNIYVTTDAGIFVANFNDNLNIPSSWDLTSIDSLIDGLDILFIHRNNSGFYLISDNSIYFFSTNDLVFDLLFEFDSDPIDIKDNNESNLFCTKSTCYYLDEFNYEILHSTEGIYYINDYYESDLYLFLAIYNGGLAKLDLSTNIIQHFIPNTLLQNQYDAITILKNGSLAGVNKSNMFIYNGSEFIYFIPNEYSDFFPIALLSQNDRFKFQILDYKIGDKRIWSIVENESGHIMFNNSGIKPNFQSQNRGAIIEINPENFDLTLYDTSKTEYMQSQSYPFGTLDGLYGISNQDVIDKYMVTHQIKKDSQGNVWIVTPFSEEQNHPVSVQIYNNPEHWMHIFSEDEVSYVPTEIAFDKYNRGWLGFKNENTNNNSETDDFSDGGIKAFQYGENYLYGTSIENYNNNVFWLSPSNLEDLPNGENSTIWSLDIGENNNQDILWVLAPQGAQGYILNNTQLLEIYPISFYTNIGFQEGDKIRTDAQNNAWITTRHSGVRVIKSNASLWPDGQGFTNDNSPLLSDYVYDIAFDNFDGKVYLATNNGISVIEIPYSVENENKESLYITPQPFIIPSDNPMIIKKILSGSDVKILSLNGHLLKHFDNLEYNQNIINWDGRDNQGKFLSTGIYYIVSYKDGQSISKKIAIIRK